MTFASMAQSLTAGPRFSNVSADDGEKFPLPQLVPIQAPINTHKASSVRVSPLGCACMCVSFAPVITLHLGENINICTGIFSTSWNISWRLRLDFYRLLRFENKQKTWTPPASSPPQKKKKSCHWLPFSQRDTNQRASLRQLTRDNLT